MKALEGTRVRIAAMGAVVLGLLATGSLLVVLAAPPSGMAPAGAAFGVGTGVLAFMLGVRHAFDADHIAAIDNTTRKLISDSRRPVSVGFFFSLGHSTVVFVLALLVASGVHAFDGALADDDSALHRITGIIGASVSGGFLYVIAGFNLIVLISIVRAFRLLRERGLDEQQLEQELQRRGVMNRLFGRFGRGIDASWRIYPVGVLFGLGFDTATEIALLVISGSAVAGGLPFWAVLGLPLLFAGGMCLFDTADGILMTTTYQWAFTRPVRKLYYNAVVTGLSVFTAFAIASVEVLGLIGTELGLRGGIWSSLEAIDLNTLGFALVGVFAVGWVIALAVWRVGRFDSRWTAPS